MENDNLSVQGVTYRMRNRRRRGGRTPLWRRLGRSARLGGGRGVIGRLPQALSPGQRRAGVVSEAGQGPPEPYERRASLLRRSGPWEAMRRFESPRGHQSYGYVLLVSFVCGGPAAVLRWLSDTVYTLI
jgi:hypothetical protein